jgi:hypothetical protein
LLLDTIIFKICAFCFKLFPKFLWPLQKADEDDSAEPAKQIKMDSMFPPANQMSSDNPRASMITNAIGRMIALDYQPYTLVENRGFKELLQILEPRYHIPASTTFSRKVIPDMYNKVLKSVKGTLERDLLGSQAQTENDCHQAPAFSFTTDVWTSRAMDAYISFTVSYVNDQFQLKTFALENKHFPGSHTADRIVETLQTSMDEWGLPGEIPIFCVRDNGSNIKAAIRKTVWYDVSCFAHTLQLAIADAIRSEEGMEHMLGKCKKIVSHYHHSCVAGGRIDKYQSDHNLSKYEFIMSCPTRWNSEFAMVERLVVLKAAVSADIADVGDIDNLTSSEWKLAQGFVSVCRPLAEATQDSSGEAYPTRSMVIPILYGLYDKLNTFINDPKSKGTGVMFARKVVSALQTRYPQYKERLPDSACTYLDPRFKYLLFDATEMEGIRKELEEFCQLVHNNITHATGVTGRSSRVISSAGKIQEETRESIATLYYTAIQHRPTCTLYVIVMFYLYPKILISNAFMYCNLSIENLNLILIKWKCDADLSTVFGVNDFNFIHSCQLQIIRPFNDIKR